MYIKIISFLLISLFLIGCSDSTENIFIGKWERIENERGYTGGFEIVKNGDTLLMVDGDEKFSANIGDDRTLQVSGPFGVVSYTYIQETGTIAGIGKEYKKVK